LNFWFEKIPSGNPDVRVRFEQQSQKRTKDLFVITYAQENKNNKITMAVWSNGIVSDCHRGHCSYGS
jgi:hypothetical protein